MTEATEMQFGGFTQVDPTNRVSSGDPDLLRGKKRIFFEGGFPGTDLDLDPDPALSLTSNL